MVSPSAPLSSDVGDRRNTTFAGGSQPGKTSLGKHALILPDDSQPHKKVAKGYSYDLYIDQALNVTVDDDVVSLDWFKSWEDLVVSVPTNRGSSDYLLVGHKLTKKTKFVMSTNACRKFVLSVLKTVEGNMKCGRCFGKYDSSHIVVTHSGKAKFKHIQMLPPTADAKRLTYDSTFEFINGLFEVGEVPPDIDHLIKLIQKREKPSLYTMHTSLDTDAYRGWSLMRMYEYVLFKANKTDKDRILAKLPHTNDWRATVNFCDVLSETYNFPGANYSPLGYLRDGKVVTDFERQLHEAEKLLEFIRHGIAHRLERQTSVTPAQHQRIVDAFYPKLAPQLQEAIFDVIGEEQFLKIFKTS